MAFVVETGVGLDDSNSYTTVAFYRDYLADRGDVDTGTDTEVEQALVKSTDHIDRRWGPLIKSVRLLSTQALIFPRRHMHDDDGNHIEGIPTRLEQATTEYAQRVRAGVELAPDPVYSESGRRIELDRIKVGPIELEEELGGTVSSQRFPDADRLMVDYLGPGGSRVSTG